ncbi:MAG: hypothetical protein Q7S89_00740 [bacterium]|nr:hypothetical protein [bacterium]
MANFVRVKLSDGGELIFSHADYSAMRNRPHGRNCGESCCPTADVTIFGFSPDDTKELTTLLVGHTVTEEPAARIAALFGSFKPVGLKHASPAQVRAMQTVFNKPGWQPPHMRS